MNTYVFVTLAAFLAVAFSQEIPPPPFLQGESPAVIAAFQKILERGAGLTDTQLDREVDAWVQTQSAGVKNRYTQFKADLKKHQEGAEAAHKAAVAKFSPAAKEADMKLSSIANSPSLTSTQKNQQIEQLVAQLPPSVRQEIESAMQGGR